MVHSEAIVVGLARTPRHGAIELAQRENLDGRTAFVKAIGPQTTLGSVLTFRPAATVR
jgi:hypothetical protein